MMFEPFFEPGDWFLPKRYGYGAGLPIAWQGWVVLGAYVLGVIGLGLLAPLGGLAMTELAVIAIALATWALIAIARARTRGGWRWRWGDED